MFTQPMMVNKNCAWISIEPSDGRIFGEVVKNFRLDRRGKDVKLLIVATAEDKDE